MVGSMNPGIQRIWFSVASMILVVLAGLKNMVEFGGNPCRTVRTRSLEGASTCILSAPCPCELETHAVPTLALLTMIGGDGRS